MSTSRQISQASTGRVRAAWLRWQSRVSGLYYRRVTEPVQLWLAVGLVLPIPHRLGPPLPPSAAPAPLALAPMPCRQGMQLDKSAGLENVGPA